MLAEVVGHEAALQVLRRAVQTGRVHHAYLLVGPPNVGKTLAALEFAKVLNCERNTAFATEAEVDCCDACASCRDLAALNHPDFRLVRPLTQLGGKTAARRAKATDEAEEEADDDDEADAEPIEIEGAMITLAQITQLVGGTYRQGGSEVSVAGHAALKISRAHKRVYLITSAENMNAESANRLLKTLEEPPPDTVFLLTSANPSRLLPTIISRCQVLTFHAVPTAEVETALAARFPAASPDLRRTVAALSGGRPGWAIRLLQRPATMPVRDRILDLCAGLKSRDTVECLRLGEDLLDATERWWLATAADPEVAEKALKQARDRVLRTVFPDLLDMLSTWFRDLIVAGADPQSATLINQDRRAQLQSLASAYDPEACRKVCLHLQNLKRQLRQNANARLASEVLALRLLTA